jgi:hypothetical protein
MGLKPGSYTVSLGTPQTPWAKEFVFPDQTVYVMPEMITWVDIDGIDYYTNTDIILDSPGNRGKSFTVNGYVNNKTLPAKVSTSMFDSFVTIFENESYVSYPIPIPVVISDDYRYIPLKPRAFQLMNITVTSYPAGAEVFVDGFRTGYITPYTFTNVSDGAHRISVVKAGYIPMQRLVTLSLRMPLVSTTYVDFDLEEYPSGFLYVNSIPQGGKITIDGMATGEITPALFRSVPIGSHLVKVTGENATKTFYDVTINELKMTNLTADFTPKGDL